MRSHIKISSIALSFGALSFWALPFGFGADLAQAPAWEVAAKWHRLAKHPVAGRLVMDDSGVEFQSAAFKQRWPYQEIQSFELTGKDLTVIGYQSRPWREPGVRRFHFTLEEAMPPDVAARLTDSVGKPSRNGAPEPGAGAIAEIAAHRRQWSGG